MIIKISLFSKAIVSDVTQRNDTNKDSNDNKIPTYMEAVTRLMFRMRWANENSNNSCPLTMNFRH